MRISILAAGTRGDVQPCISLAKTLKKRNYDVLLAANKEYQNLAEDNNIKFAELPGDPSDKWNDSNKKRMKFSEQMEYYGKIWLETVLEICQDSDAIVYTSLFFVGNHIAEKLNIPYFQILYEPNITTGEFPSPYLGTEKQHNRTLNKITHNFGYYSFWLKIRKVVNKLRDEKLDLPPSPYWGYFSNYHRSSVNYLCCFSGHLVKKPSDWANNILISGYWFLENENTYSPNNELAEFISKGKPVYFDFGSFSHDILRPKVNLIIADLIKGGERLLIDPGKMDISNFDFSENTKIIDRTVPHEWILPNVKSIITHGGVGAVHAAMRAGTPTIPVTMFPAQFYWGNLTYKLNLGAKPIRIRQLKSGDIISSIDYIGKNPKLRENLHKIKLGIETENAVDIASDFISKKLTKTH